MRQKINDELIRNFFTNKGQTMATEDFRYPNRSPRPDSEDSLVQRGLEMGRFYKQDSEFDEFFNITQTRNLTLADISFLTRSHVRPEKLDKRQQLRTTRNTRKRTFVSSNRIGSPTRRSWLRGFLVMVSFVLTLGIISPSPLTNGEEVSGGQKEDTGSSLMQVDTALTEKWNEAVTFFENTLSKFLD